MKIKIPPTELTGYGMRASWVVKVVKIEKGKVLISAGGVEHWLWEGEEFNFSINLD